MKYTIFERHRAIALFHLDVRIQQVECASREQLVLIHLGSGMHDPVQKVHISQVSVT